MGVLVGMGIYVVSCIVKVLVRMQLVKLSLVQYKNSLLTLNTQTPSKVPNRFTMYKGKIP